MEQFEWTPGGKELLLTIESYVQQHGGNHSLLKSMMEEDRKYKAIIKMCSGNGGSRTGPRKRKRVKLIKGKTRRIFRDLDSAAVFLGKSNTYLRNAVRIPFKVSGWDVSYLRKNKVG